MDHTSGERYRSKCGAARVEYDPEWDSKQPWVSFLHGTAGRQFATLDQAVQHFKAKGYLLIVPKTN